MKIAVTSPSFSSHKQLIMVMKEKFTDYKLNTEGLRLKDDLLIEYLKNYDAAIIGLEEINKDVIDALPNLKIIAKYGVGLNNIDIDYCNKRGIKIGWTGGVNKLSVAEMVIGNTLSLLRNLYTSSNLLKSGQWVKNGGHQLTGKTIGIIGVGHIGKELIRLLAPFHCQILVNDIIDQALYYESVGAVHCDKETIFQKSDVVTIHTPLNESTQNLINRDSLSLFQKHAILINTARGGIVNEADLAEALDKGNVGGAALDVYLEEPPTQLKNLNAPNLICTPHIGGNSVEAVFLMGMSAIDHLLDFQRGL